MASSSRRLPPPEIESRLRAQFGDDVLAFEDQSGHAVVTIPAERYRELVTFLRDEPEFACDYCDFTGGVDLPDRFEVVTHLFSTRHHHHVRLKVPLPREDPACPTISDLFPTANWHEREIMEMFGIDFPEHPQPVKLLLPEPFEGHPLRKDFPLATREAKPWPGEAEGEEEEEA
ncbi:MAG TPA: NADH-quinone oxidoreductase subunit C [Actinomycetota bacterium]|nr:NADH-quinone oxidoreductase subunit C [Actinomycetota bacterium]